MSYNKSLLAFDDIKPEFDKALLAKKGIKIRCDSHAKAIVLRSRFNYYRTADRKENAKSLEPAHPLHGRSVYDKLILRVPRKGDKDDNCVFLEKRSSEGWLVEEIE